MRNVFFSRVASLAARVSRSVGCNVDAAALSWGKDDRIANVDDVARKDDEERKARRGEAEEVVGL